jgi:hypothetical protein
MKTKGTLCVVAALGGLILALAGCGGGGKAAQVTFPTVTTPTVPASVTTVGTTSGLGNLASAANCRQLADLGSQMSAAFSGANKNIQTQAQLLQQFADKTPADIRPDFEVFAGAYAKIADALKGVNLNSGKVPSAAVLAKLQALSTQLNQPALQKASAHIATWASKNCHA